jgi:hypothetical protein
MNTAHLSRTATLLRQPSDSAAAEYEAVRDGLAEELSHRMMARADLDKLIGQDNLAMMQDRAYRSHGFHTTYWAANLDTFVELVRERLTPPTFEQVVPFFEWLIVSIPSFVTISDEQMAEPLGPTPGHEPRIHP